MPANNNRTAKWTAAGGVLSALGVCAACCLFLFGLLSVGIAGAWVITLDALAPYKWTFICLTAALLGYGFYAVYYTSPKVCATGSTCEANKSERTARIGLWIATLLAISGLVFERLEPMLRSH